jgi:hypothetical protein
VGHHGQNCQCFNCAQRRAPTCAAAGHMPGCRCAACQRRS